MLWSRRARCSSSVPGLRLDRQRPDLDHVAQAVMPSGASSCLASAPAATRAAVSRALARSRIARTDARYLIEPLRSPWPGRGRARSSICVDLVVLVGDQQGDGAAQRDAAPDAAEDVDVIGLDLLPAAAAIAALAAAQLGVDRLRLELRRRRESRPPGPTGPCRAIRRRSSIATSSISA